MKKVQKGFRFYAIVTQFLLQTFLLVALGVWGGARLDELWQTSFLSALLGLVGIVIGLGSFIFFVLRGNR
jgi:hypothetical protein